jgi:MoCo/4Fe-4S cofactor protein with predicted Tat translocation signal
MKRVFQHPPEDLTGKKYWRSLEQLADTPEFRSWLEREFPQDAAELQMDGVSRRNFLRVMGASMALAGIGLSGCRRPESHIVPYTKSVEWLIPGKSVLYTTAMPGRKGGLPLIATTYEGRPTKLEGNPLVPSSNGATDVFAQASILELYDPERSRGFIEGGKESNAQRFEEYLGQVRQELQSTQGTGFAVLLDEQYSPTRERLLQALKRQYPQLNLYTYEPTGSEELAKALENGFSADFIIRPEFDAADVVLSLDHDFLGAEETVEGVRSFSQRRRAHGSAEHMNRLYAVENRFTTTGGMADHRLRCAASQIPTFAVQLARKIAGSTNDRELQALAEHLPEGGGKFDDLWITECANDLVARRGRSLVLVGHRYPSWVQGLVLAINSALGAFGSTLLLLNAPRLKTGNIQELTADVKSGTVKRLFILSTNPGYTAPADLQWGEVQKTIPEVVRLGYYFDETSAHAKWHVPEAHFLESWGDQRAGDGTYLPIQPMILPLFGGLSQLDVLSKLAGLPGGLDAVRETFRTLVKEGDFETVWTRLLREGYAADAGYAVAEQRLDFKRIADLIHGARPLPGPVGPSALEIVFPADNKILDGRYNNNAWLQELPDAVTKLTWDNALLLSRATAKAIGVGENDLVELTLNDRKIQAAVMIAPGHADFSMTLTLGYGREVVGKVGRGTGFNAYRLRTTESAYYGLGAGVQLLKKNDYRLAQTQMHHSMEGRALVREGTIEDYKENPEFAKTMWMDAHIPENVSLYSHPPLNAPNQWGMVVDLNTCTGCSACVIACQAENNIPVVGKDQVLNSREMHWIRIDRYFSSTEGDRSWPGDEENPALDGDPEMVMEPVMCQHCENAPCETVCPVNATVHSEDGLNVMAYNRCIGTRYCANNCPFKVRRFNFFNYNDRPVFDRIEHGVPLLFEGKQQLYLGPLAPWGMEEMLKMSKNPNVTVRIRGVMEKCTYCVQRIETAKIAQRIKAGTTGDLTLPTDSVKAACQQVCPSEAIVFGDINDPESRVSLLRALPQNYHLLEYLNIQTRTSYLARLRNPNPKMPGAAKIGRINGEQHHRTPDKADHDPLEEPKAEVQTHGGQT